MGTRNDNDSHNLAMPNDDKGKNGKKSVKMIGDFVLGKILGTGSYGHVRLGVHQHTGQQVAIKTLKIKDQKSIKTVDREISILKLLRHPNIVRLYDVIVVEDNKQIGESMSQPKTSTGLAGFSIGLGTAYLVLELASGGELFDYVVARGRLKEKEARKFFRQIVSGLEYCHSNLVIHRDLKPENLLLDKDGNIKINDFGFSNIMRPGTQFSTYCGSLSYVAPEIIRNIPYTGPEIDIWSLGVILYTLVCGRLPWQETPEGGPSIQGILRADYDKNGLKHLSDDCKHLMSRILVPDSTLRATMQEIRAHPWVNEGYDSPPPCLVPTHPPVTVVNEEVLAQLVGIGFDEYETCMALRENKRCSAVATYHLLLSRWEAENNINNLTINSNSSNSSPNSPQTNMMQGSSWGDSSVLNSGVSGESEENGSNGSSRNSPQNNQNNQMNQMQRRSSVGIPSNHHDPDLENRMNDMMRDDIQTRSARIGSAPPRPDFNPLKFDSTPHLDVVSTPPLSPHQVPIQSKLNPVSRSRRSSRRMSTMAPTSNYGSPAVSASEGIYNALSLGAQSPLTGDLQETSQSRSLRTFTIATPGSSPFTDDPMVTPPTRKSSFSGSSSASHTPSLTVFPTLSPRQSVPVNGAGVATPRSPARKLVSSMEAAFKSLLKPDMKKPKEVRLKEGVFSVETTTTLHPSLIVDEIKRVLDPNVPPVFRNGSSGSFTGILNIEYKHKGYLFECEDKETSVRFEIEVCKIKGTEGWNGIRLKRIKGDLWLYKDLCQKLMSRIHL